MEQKEIVQILTIKTADSAKNVADLKENISALKQVLNEETATKEQNAKAAELLRANQNALRDAMYATTQTSEQLAAKSKVLIDENNKVNGSYNDLVHTMAELKMAWRATNDEAERQEIGKSIKVINDRLKDMDSSVGNFQRNVGDYQNAVKGAFKDMANGFDAFGKGMKIAKGGVNDFKDTAEGLAKSPMIATFAILVSAVSNIAEDLKENEGVMKSIQSVMSSMKPIMDFFSGIIEKLATYVADIIGKVGEFVTNNGIAQKVTSAIVGIGNAIVKYITAPFKGVIEAIKVFQEEGIKGLRNAGKAFLGEMKEGISFRQNFQAGEALAETIISGAKSKTAETKEAGKQMALTMKEGYDDAWDEIASDNEAYKMLHKEIEERKKAEEEARKERVAREKEMHKEIVQMAEETAKREKELYDEDKAKAEEVANAKIALQNAVADATSGILGVIADQMELNSKEDEKNAKKVKALRIASATIDTISGAIGAFTQASKTYPPPYGQIIGSTNAALVTATGLANIAKIKSTDVSGGGSGGGVSAVVSAPQTGNNMTAVRSITTQSEEERLNKMAKDQRVYILASDIQASNNSTKVQVAESSF